MPGLRSLIARRRCSLPVQSLIHSQNLGSYSTVVSSFDTCHSLSEKESLNKYTSDNNICAESEGKWDLHSLFHSNNLPIEDRSSDFLCDKLGTENFLSLPNNEKVIDSEEIDKENIAITATASEKNIDDSYIEASSIEHSIATSHSNNYSTSSTESSPERIVIKMKLLHRNSLNEIANIPTDSSECIVEEAVTSASETKSSNLTRWMIDSILNEPVVETENKSELLPIKESESHLEYVLSNEIESNTSATDTFCNDTLVSPIINLKKSPYLHSKNVEENCCQPHLDEKEDKDSDIEKVKLDLTYPKMHSHFINYSTNIRRPSDGEISEDSLSSDISAKSSSSSNVKSCSIVIKRIDNSGTYGCFQSPKSKRKKMISRPSHLYKEKSINNHYEANDILFDKSLINLFPNMEMTNLPCSVILCDIFHSILKTKRSCSFCFTIFDLESSLSVDVGKNTITFQCNKCDWLNIYKLISRNVQIYPVH